jgi:magnesium transporter
MIRIYSENNGAIQTKECTDIDSIVLDTEYQWIDLENENNNVIRAVLMKFQYHELAIQDALRDRHPPKLESFEDEAFMLYKGIGKVNNHLDISHVQMAFFIRKNILISIHKDPSFGISNIQNNEQLARWIKNPALLWSKILNNSALKYLQEILKVEDELADLEDRMSTSGDDNDLTNLIVFKTRLRRLHRTASYHERVIKQLQNETNQCLMFDDAMHVYQDLYDKYERIQSLTAMYYDLCGDLIDGYLSLTSHRLNKTMQILTVITAIFIPLGLLAGIYGMNFDNIPELHHPYGYYILLGTMFSTASILFFIFKKRKWLE